MKLGRKYIKKYLGQEIQDKNKIHQTHRNTDRPNIASPNLEINNQQVQKHSSCYKSIIKGKTIKQKAKKACMNNVEDNWKNKVLHRNYPNHLSKPDMGQTLTHHWLKGTDLKRKKRFCYCSARSELTYQKLSCKRP